MTYGDDEEGNMCVGLFIEDDDPDVGRGWTRIKSYTEALKVVASENA